MWADCCYFAAVAAAAPVAPDVSGVVVFLLPSLYRFYFQYSTKNQIILNLSAENYSKITIKQESHYLAILGQIFSYISYYETRSSPRGFAD